MQALRKWNVLGEALCGVFRGVYFHRGWNFWLLLMIPWSRCAPLLALVLVALLRAFKTTKTNV